MANIDAAQSKKSLRHILKLSEDIFRVVRISIPQDWLSSDMTVAQLRVLLLLHTEGPARMGLIASSIGSTLPAVTGTVDVLVKKGLVVRKDDPDDRRIVICELSKEGQEMMSRMWQLGQRQMEKLLHGLSVVELQKAEEVAEILFRNAISNADRF
jgi:DNA-binding MarR family transcriptional regulator